MKPIKELINLRNTKISDTKKAPILKETRWNASLGLETPEMKKIINSKLGLQVNEKNPRPVFKILFSGGSAADKTKAAKMIARHLGIEIHRIKFSEILSENVADAEKKITKIINEATTNNWILFFDEADALFGKRTNVKDAHDRYANQEISFLLQKLEEYEGAIIFNCRECSSLDQKFAKYFQTIIHFPVGPKKLPK